jgi:integrase
LRHTHAALLVAQGEHPKVIESRLGHTSISTTLDTYGHLMEGLDAGEAERLDELASNRSGERGLVVGI